MSAQAVIHKSNNILRCITTSITACSRHFQRSAASSTHVPGVAQSLGRVAIPQSRVSDLGIRGKYIPFYSKVHRDMSYEVDEEKYIVTKNPSDTKREFLLPFNSDKLLRESYLAHTGQLRIGKILEDLDALAGAVAYDFADGWNEERPLTIVTASTDTITLHNRIHPDRDLKFTGQVNWVGRSSIVIGVEVQAYIAAISEWERILEGQFTMVARDKASQRAAQVNRLEPVTSDEKKMYELYKADSKRRKEARLSSLDREPPTDAERELIHRLFLEHKHIRNETMQAHTTRESLRPLHVNMADTELTSSGLMHPQDRNIHSKVFGGMLMRIGYETAWASCLLFTGSRPQFIAQDEVSFLEPVEIGSLVKFSATVVYTVGPLVQVRVLAERVDPVTSIESVTNTFHYTFRSSSPQRFVVPRTYEDAMLYIEGKRVLERNRKA